MSEQFSRLLFWLWDHIAYHCSVAKQLLLLCNSMSQHRWEIQLLSTSLGLNLVSNWQICLRWLERVTQGQGGEDVIKVQQHIKGWTLLYLPVIITTKAKFFMFRKKLQFSSHRVFQTTVCLGTRHTLYETRCVFLPWFYGIYSRLVAKLMKNSPGLYAITELSHMHIENAFRLGSPDTYKNLVVVTSCSYTANCCELSAPL